MDWQHNQSTRSFKVGPEDNHHLFSFFQHTTRQTFRRGGKFCINRNKTDSGSNLLPANCWKILRNNDAPKRSKFQQEVSHGELGAASTSKAILPRGPLLLCLTPAVLVMNLPRGMQRSHPTISPHTISLQHLHHIAPPSAVASALLAACPAQKLLISFMMY